MVSDILDIGVYTKNKKNLDQQWKRKWKMCIGSKVMAKTKLTKKLLPCPLYFGPKVATKKGTSSHRSSELIFMFLESVEQGEWE